MINIAEILKDCPKGTKLYSPICGDCTFEKIHLNTSIVVCAQYYTTITFDVYGHYFRDYDNTECLLFPSKENRDWNKFKMPIVEGDVVVAEDSENLQMFIVKKYISNNEAECYIGYDFNDDSIFNEANWEFDRIASKVEKEKLFDAIKKHGYKWNTETKTLEKLIVPKFKDGDIISNDVYIAIFHKFDKPQLCGYNKVVYYHCWCYQNGKGFKFEKDYGIGRDTEYRFATDGEKQKLFNVIKENGYKWNPETKTLEKLIVPKFKVGDQIVRKNSISNSYIVNSVSSEYYGLVLPDRTGIGVLNVSEQDDWELVLPIHKFKVGDKIVKKDIPTECWYVQGVNTNCNSDYFYSIVAKGKIANLHFKDQDNWELVPTHKFKVGDKVKHIHTGIYCHIKAYGGELKGYYTSIGHFIKDDNVDEWEIIPNKFDISTLKAYDKVLVRDTNEQVWVADLFSHVLDRPLGGYTFACVGHYPNQCIPYLGNQHLLGTCDDCDEYYKNW